MHQRNEIFKEHKTRFNGNRNISAGTQDSEKQWGAMMKQGRQGKTSCGRRLKNRTSERQARQAKSKAKVDKEIVIEDELSLLEEFYQT